MENLFNTEILRNSLLDVLKLPKEKNIGKVRKKLPNKVKETLIFLAQNELYVIIHNLQQKYEV